MWLSQHRLDDMTDSTLWWLLAGGAIVFELLSGTFYLLMLATGLVAGALAAHAGASLAVQIVAAAVVGGGAVMGWNLYRQKNAARTRVGANPDVNLDIGETVYVESWQPDGSTSVKYRGAQWSAVHNTGALPSHGAHRIVEVRGSQLVIEKSEP
jgi:membrane protein implicated in regulation of membrane protease activity